MKKIFYAAMAALVLLNVGCSKDDGGRKGAGFDFGVPGNLRQTSKIAVSFEVECDAMPTVRFRPEDGALGVVSPVEDAKFGTDYFYAAEPITVNYSAGRATATFWYIPLTGGNHTVSFMVEYKQGGESQTGVNVQTFEVKDDWFGNFYPVLNNDDPGRYYFSFRNEVDKQKNGCKMYLCFGEVNGEKDPAPMNITLTQGKDPKVTLVADTFYPVQWGVWDSSWNDWMNSNIMVIRNDLVDPITMHLTFRDDYNRCRDVEVKMDENRNLISSTYGDYYLWPKGN